MIKSRKWTDSQGKRWARPGELWVPSHCANAFGHGHGHGLGNAPEWDPSYLVQPGNQWLWADLDAAGAVTHPADPTIPGAGWSGANWVGSGLGPYTHTAGATTALTNAVLTVGLRYLVRFTVSGRTAGTVTLTLGATSGAARSTNATFTEELTCTTSTGLSFVPSNDFDGAVTVVSAVAIAVNLVTCKGNLGNLAQATDANMPWSSDADAPTSAPVNGKRVLYFDGVVDIIGSNQPAASWPIHHAAGMTASLYINPVVGGAQRYIIATCRGTTTEHGVGLVWDNGGQRMQFFVLNGTGAVVINAFTANNTAPHSTPHIVSLTWSSAGLRLLLDGLAPLIVLNTGLASAAPATDPLQVGAMRPGTPLNGYAGPIGQIFVKTVAAPDPDLLKLHNWMRSYYAV